MQESIVKQPKGFRGSNGSMGNGYGNRETGKKYFTAFTETYVSAASDKKRRRPSLWETLTGLVCSLGALATRAAKMAARRGDSL